MLLTDYAMKKITHYLSLLATLFVLSTNHVNAQDIVPNLLKSFPLGGIPYDIKVDNLGNSYVTGYFNVCRDFGGTTVCSAGGIDMFLAKYDYNGNLIWVKRGGGADSDLGYSLDITDNHVYVTGAFIGNANFNTPSATGSNELVSRGMFEFSANDQDIFLAKYTLDGDLVWIRRAGGVNYDYAKSIAVYDNNVYITGNFSNDADFNTPTLSGTNEISSAGNSDIFVAKYTSDGDFIWAKRAGGAGSDFGQTIAISNGNIYVGGDFAGTANFNTPSAIGFNELVANGGGNSDGFITKYDVDGNVLWMRRMGSTDYDEVTSIAVHNNEVYAVGAFRFTANFNTPSAAGSNELISAGQHDIFITKFDENGNFQWAKRGGASGYERPEKAVANANGVYLTGTFIFTINFNTPSATGSNSITSAGNDDMFIAHFDADGNYQWAKRGGANLTDNGYGIAVHNNEIYTVGKYANSANFNTPSSTASNTLPSGNDFYFVRFGCNTTAPTADASQSFCTPATLADVVIAGSSIKWYDQATSGNLIANNAPLVDGVTYYASQTNVCESTTRTAVTVTLLSSPIADVLANATACDSYFLPSLSSGAYYTNTNGGGTNLAVGTAISSSQTIYIYATNGTCSDESTFTVTINTTPSVDELANVTSCDSYLLPSLSVGNYFTNINGTGTSYAANDIITSTQTLYIYAANGSCTDEYSFDIVITPTPSADAPGIVNICDEYVLPALTVGNYYTASSGGGSALSAFDVVTSSTILYVYAENGTCSDENSFSITINLPPTVDNPSNATECDEYVLPALNVGDYYTDVNGGGTLISAGTTLNASTTLFVYAQNGCGTDEHPFDITINTTPQADILNDVSACDTYELLSLNTGSYYTQINGGGVELIAGDDITSSQTLYIYAENNGCANESSFNVTINATPSPVVSNNGNVLSVNISNATYQWVDCNNGNEAINGAINSSFSPSANGSYAVEVTLDGCTATSACVTYSNTTSINENSTTLFTVYPNPAKETIFVVANQSTEIAIYSVTGVLIEKRTPALNHELNVSYLANGVYFIKAGEHIVKFIKE
jgi:hypothetical protein